MERPAGQWGIRKRGTRSRQTLGRRADRVRESGFVAFIVSHENFLLHEVSVISGHIGLLGTKTCFILFSLLRQHLL